MLEKINLVTGILTVVPAIISFHTPLSIEELECLESGHLRGSELVTLTASDDSISQSEFHVEGSRPCHFPAAISPDLWCDRNPSQLHEPVRIALKQDLLSLSAALGDSAAEIP